MVKKRVDGLLTTRAARRKRRQTGMSERTREPARNDRALDDLYADSDDMAGAKKPAHRLFNPRTGLGAGHMELALTDKEGAAITAMLKAG
jgi:hypothetical protein